MNIYCVIGIYDRPKNQQSAFTRQERMLNSMPARWQLVCMNVNIGEENSIETYKGQHVLLKCWMRLVTFTTD